MKDLSFPTRGRMRRPGAWYFTALFLSSNLLVKYSRSMQVEILFCLPKHICEGHYSGDLKIERRVGYLCLSKPHQDQIMSGGTWVLFLAPPQPSLRNCGAYRPLFGNCQLLHPRGKCSMLIWGRRRPRQPMAQAQTRRFFMKEFVSSASLPR